MEDLKYSEIISLNRKYKNEIVHERLGISVLSNITLNPISDILELQLYNQSIPSKVVIADFDNIIQESHKSNQKVQLIFWETSNLIENLHYQIYNWDEVKLQEFIEKIKSDIQIVLNNLNKSSLIIFNKFSSLAFDYNSIYCNNLNRIATELNLFLEKFSKTNLKLVDIDKIIAGLGIRNAIDLRSYQTKKTLYTIDFFKSYSKYINSHVLALTGQLKKVIVLDCDNTLWGGILGEEGCDGINMSETSAVGAIFLEVQHKLVQAYNSGILLCLCSKNNLNDVEEVFEINSNMILKRNNIIVSKCNWQEKYKNLNEIATELSLGLESFIFIDDSDFELNQMKLMLPEVKCVKVPDNIFEYTQVIDQTLSMYFNFTLTGEDRNRNLLYKQNLERESLKQNFLSIDEYLSSLKIEIVVNSNEIKYLDRISQLTQKTNQFNLTTKRYSEKEIENFIYSKNYDVYSFNVSDKFGSNGLTAIVIVEYISKSESYIDTFLMSCRIIGRNIENVILDHIVRELRSKGILILGSKYLRTKKNNQVENFFEKAGFNLVDSIESIKSYSILLDEYKFSKIDYINIH